MNKNYTNTYKIKQTKKKYWNYLKLNKNVKY